LRFSGGYLALPFLGEQLVGTDPVSVVVGNRGDDQLVGTRRFCRPVSFGASSTVAGLTWYFAADRRGRSRGEGEDDSWRGAGGAGVEVVLGEPVAGVAEAFCVPGQVDAVAQCLGCGAAGSDGHQVEHGERRGGHDRFLHVAEPASAALAGEPARSGARSRCSRSVLP
jgi:hypothetical protein